MRQAVVKKAPRGQGVARPYQRSAPIKGWVTNQNLAAMQEDAAYVMDNWFPETDMVRMRRGSTTYATLPSTTEAVHTVMEYQAGNVERIFAAQGEYIYNVTAGGAITTPDVSGRNGDKYIYQNFATSGGNFLVTANGTDNPINYDGTSWSEPAIEDVTGGYLNYVFNYKSRLFYLQNNSSDAWFLPADSIAGSAQKIALGGNLTLGGTIIAGGPLSVDSGFGPDDYCAFISSEGEVVLFSGVDPADADDWTLRGVYRINQPIGNRCVIKIAGDLGILTAIGLVSLTKAVQLDLAASEKGAYSANIQNAFTNQYALSGQSFGWQIVSWPSAHMAIVNVPISTDSVSEQYVMNVLTGAWARYTGMNASCFCLAGTVMYFGSVDGRVVLFESGASDNGTQVAAVMIPGWSVMKAPGRLKHVKNIQAFFRGYGVYTVGMNIAADFESVASAATILALQSSSGSLWDGALWDQGVWSDGTAVNTVWLGVAGSGYYLSPVIFGLSNATSNENTDIQFLLANLLYEDGAIIG